MNLFEFADLDADRDNRRDPESVPDETATSEAELSPTVTGTPANLRATVVTLADALRVAETKPGVTASCLTDWRSAVATAARVTSRKPEEMPIAPRDMVPLLKAVRPGLFRMKAKRWANVRSSLAGLAAMVGWHAGRERMRLELTGEWALLRDTLARSPQKANLAGFARYCLTEGIAPGQVTEATVEGYRTWRASETYDLGPNSTIHGLRRIWNANAGKTDGWPAQKLPAPKDPRIFALPLEDFPEAFRRELDDFVEMLRAPDPFNKESRRKLAETTLRDRRGHLIRAASILVLTGRKSLVEIDGLKVLAEPAAMKAVLRFMYEKAGRKWNNNAVDMAIVLHDIGRLWLKLDAAALAPLEDLHAAVKTERAGIGKRSLQRLEAFDDPMVLKRFFKLPGDLFKAADKLEAEKRHDQAARLHERALALAILQLQPLRRRTLALIDIDKHLRRDMRGRFVTLSMPGALVKNGIDISAPIPDDLSRRLTKHVRVYLPSLKGDRSGSWLFPGDTPAGHKDPQTLARTITKEVEHALGIEFSLHMVRHVAATVLYASSPDAGPVAQRLLAHRQLTTTESFYGRVKTRSAHRQWGDILDGMRATERKKKSRRGSGGTGDRS